MAEMKICPQCGAALPPDAPVGICPQCLLRVGLASDPPVSGGSGWEAATLAPNESASAPTKPTASDQAGSKIDSKSAQPSGAKVRYFGDYELLEEIARGGMGVVFKARQVNLNRVVALKMILAGQLANELDVQRFHAEAEAAAKLDHPGIVPIFEIGQHEEQHYFSMGFVAGESLAKTVAAGPLLPRQSAELVKQIAEAVEYAHSKGIIHRDLKPANVLLDKSGQPRVTDFGLAKQLKEDSGLTGTGQILGTPSYMPPEQAAGKLDQIGPPSDVYSLGAILYCLLTGRPPFQAASPLDTLRQVLEQEPVPARQLNAQVPLDLDTVTLKCLEKDSRRRYATARELADELGRFLSGEPVLARPIGNLSRAVRWCRRKPVAATAAALGLLLVVSLAVSMPIVTLSMLEAVNQKRIATVERNVAVEERKKAVSSEKKTLQARAEELVAKSEAGQASYNSRMSLAIRGWDASKIGFTQLNLEAAPTAPRGWEHRFLSGLAYRSEQTLIAPYGGASCLAFSPDGERILAAGAGLLWNAKNGQIVLRFPGDSWGAFSADGQSIVLSGEKGVRAVDAQTAGERFTIKSEGKTLGVASADGKYILAAGDRGGASLYDGKTGELVRTLPQTLGFVSSAAFSPDSRKVVFGQKNGEVQVWDVETAQPILKLGKQASKSVDVVAFSPDGKQIVSVSWEEGTLWVSDAHTGKEQFSPQGLKLGVNAFRTTTFSPDGRFLATGHEDGSVRLWNARTGQPAFTLKGHPGLVFSLAFSPDGRRIVSASVGFSVIVWDLTNDQGFRSLAGHGDKIQSVRFSPDSQRVVSAGEDKSIRAWNVRSGRQVLSLTGLPAKILNADVTPDGERIVAWGGDDLVRTWLAASGESPFSFPAGSAKIREHHGVANILALSADGRRVASAESGLIKVYDVQTGKQLAEQDVGALTIGDLAWRPDGKRIAFVDIDSRMTSASIGYWEWEAAGEQKRLTNWDNAVVNRIAYSPDGKSLIAAGYTWIPGVDTGAALVCDAQTGQETFTLLGHLGPVWCASYNRDGTRILTGGGDGAIKIWDARTGQELFTLPGEFATIRSVAWSPDGKWIAAGGDDRQVRVWPADQITPQVQTLKVKTIDRRMGFLPGGEQFVTASADGGVLIWDVATGKEVRSLASPANVSALALGRDGKRIVGGCSDGSIRVWNAKTGVEETTINGFTQGIRCVAISAGGEYLAAGSDDDGGIKVWRCSDSKELFSAPARPPAQPPPFLIDMSFSPNGQRLLASYYDSEIKVWSVPDGQELLSYQSFGGATEGNFKSAAFSADSERITTSSQINTGKVWHAANGKILFTFAGSFKGFTSDGQRMVINEGFLVKQLDSLTGREFDQDLLPAPNHELIDSMAYISAEGALTRLAYAKASEVRLYVTPPTLKAARTARLSGMAEPSAAWHASQAEEAAAAKDPFAVVWHLERQARLQPNKAELEAKLMQAQLELERARAAP